MVGLYLFQIVDAIMPRRKIAAKAAAVGAAVAGGSSNGEPKGITMT